MSLACSYVSIRYLQIQLHISGDWKHVSGRLFYHNSKANEYIYKIIRQITKKVTSLSCRLYFAGILSAILSEMVSQLVLVGRLDKDPNEKSEPRISVLIPARLIPKRGHGSILTALP